ncbi:MAG: hypothetical protein M0Z99_06060 [Betaproteobacteria bacterium]|uniref:Uncharacterized protein n=1 Tax=Thiomonas delicata TaxID=364030 RepID=A0A238D9P6_THIDL|nr:hypothetical protein [Thiomonas delicata]MDA8255188.1 hypothetical protein [Betaproteobacteria bacterium]SBP90036.1 exported hypothetical protein [Thiomonas delicata]
MTASQTLWLYGAVVILTAAACATLPRAMAALAGRLDRRGAGRLRLVVRDQALQHLARDVHILAYLQILAVVVLAIRAHDPAIGVLVAASGWLALTLAASSLRRRGRRLQGM